MDASPTEKKENLASAAMQGTSWFYFAFYSGKLIVFISTIVLARLLTKDDYGIVGYALAITGFLDVIKDLGIGSSVIYHKDEKVADTAFWLSMATGALLFLLVFFSAPLASGFFKDARVSQIIQVLALSFPLNALGATHEALLIKNLEFRRKFIPDFARAITKGVIAISLAFLGFGPWSLIISQLVGTSVSVIILWNLVRWRPSFVFATDVARSLLAFGLPLVGMNVVSAVALNIDYLLVGRYLGSESLGVYTLAFRIPELTILQFCVIVAQVIFPIFNKIRDDADALKRGFLETARYVALITVPIGLGMALLSEPFVLTFFGEKWLEAVPVMRAISIYSLFISLGFNAGDVYKAQGKPGMLTRMSILHVFLLVPALLWAVKVPASIVMVGWVQAWTAFVISLVYLIVALRMLKMSMSDLFNALRTPVIPGIGLTGAVFAVIYFTGGVPAWLQLILGVVAGGFAYVGLLYLTQRTLVTQSIRLVQTVLTAKSS